MNLQDFQARLAASPKRLPTPSAVKQIGRIGNKLRSLVQKNIQDRNELPLFYDTANGTGSAIHSLAYQTGDDADWELEQEIIENTTFNRKYQDMALKIVKLVKLADKLANRLADKL